MSLKLPTGTNALMSMECLWPDVFTVVKIMVIAKMIVNWSDNDNGTRSKRSGADVEYVLFQQCSNGYRIQW